MAKRAKVKKSSSSSSRLLTLRQPEAKIQATASNVHVFGNKVRCDTESRGHATPGNLDPARLVLDATRGFIPLWEPNVTLRWRFKQSSLDSFANPAALTARVEDLLAKALLAWGDAVPIRFSKVDDNHDFQIVVRENDDCDINGCVLASAFFPDAGQHDFVIYPQMFTQSEQEQIETMCHEVGHIFGLRHFFAQILETDFPSQVFGVHDKFTIMNYGPNSRLTEIDKADLIRLYDEVWSGERTKVNGTPIRLFKPFSTNSALSSSLLPVPMLAQSQAALTRPSAYATSFPRMAREVVYARAR